MNAHAPRYLRRTTVLIAACSLWLAWLVYPSIATAAPDPVAITVSLTASLETGNCVAHVSWQEGKGQLYVQMILMRDTASGPEFQASHAQKVSASGDPRGSRTLTYEFSNALPLGGGSGQMLEVVVKRAKGKGGTSGDEISTSSMMVTGERAACG